MQGDYRYQNSDHTPLGFSLIYQIWPLLAKKKKEDWNAILFDWFSQGPTSLPEPQKKLNKKKINSYPLCIFLRKHYRPKKNKKGTISFLEKLMADLLVIWFLHNKHIRIYIYLYIYEKEWYMGNHACNMLAFSMKLGFQEQ